MSKPDQRFIDLLRASVNRHVNHAVERYDLHDNLVMNVAPQRELVNPFRHATVETLDIDPDSGATHIADLCDRLPHDLIERYDLIICTEVIEHCIDPFAAAHAIMLMLKPQGTAYVTTPFNLRIHNPQPDLWRFTERGLRELFKNYDIVSLEAEETPERELMPVGYRMIVRHKA
jgi:hypothetical protein